MTTIQAKQFGGGIISSLQGGSQPNTANKAGAAANTNLPVHVLADDASRFVTEESRIEARESTRGGDMQSPTNLLRCSQVSRGGQNSLIGTAPDAKPEPVSVLAGSEGCGTSFQSNNFGGGVESRHAKDNVSIWPTSPLQEGKESTDSDSPRSSDKARSRGSDRPANSFLSDLVLELFSILEVMEMTDEGRIFHPTTISSCRTLTAFRLKALLPEMKRLAQLNE